MAGRPRIHDPEKTRRVITTMPTDVVNPFDILAEYLTVHTPPQNGKPVVFTRNSLLNTAAVEYLRSHGTIVEQAVTWWKKGKKPPKEVVE